MKVSLGPVQETATVEAEKLATRKVNTVNVENQKVGDARKQIITDIAGQQMIYIFKHFEAQAFLADPQVATAETCPFIFAEVGITAPTAAEVAQVFANLSHQWVQIAVGQEKDRLTKTQEILSAQTNEELAKARE